MDSKNASQKEGIGILPGSSVRAYVSTFAVLAGLLIVFGGLMSTRANADYICTRVIEDSGSCTNGAWGTWQTSTSSTDPNTGDQTIEEARIYTGTRVLRHTIQYLNLRTSCNAGYQQQKVGNSKGQSGYHGGKIITESQVCQIQESRTRIVDGDTGTETINGTVTTTDVTNNGQGGGAGATTRDETTVNSLAEINEFRRANRDLGLIVQPSIVSPGQTTTVKWTTVEMNACIVTADKNSDRWGAASLADGAFDGAFGGEGGGGVVNSASTAGEEESSPITEATTYTLSCIDFEGNPMPNEQATVYLVPEWQEI